MSSFSLRRKGGGGCSLKTHFHRVLGANFGKFLSVEGVKRSLKGAVRMKNCKNNLVLQSVGHKQDETFLIFFLWFDFCTSDIFSV